jgi:hypothetical protein
LILTSTFLNILSTAIVLLTSVLLLSLFIRCSRNHSLQNPSKYLQFISNQMSKLSHSYFYFLEFTFYTAIVLLTSVLLLSLFIRCSRSHSLQNPSKYLQFISNQMSEPSHSYFYFLEYAFYIAVVLLLSKFVRCFRGYSLNQSIIHYNQMFNHFILASTFLATHSTPAVLTSSSRRDIPCIHYNILIPVLSISSRVLLRSTMPRVTIICIARRANW